MTVQMNEASTLTDGLSTNDTTCILVEISFSFFLYDIARAKQDAFYWGLNKSYNCHIWGKCQHEVREDYHHLFSSLSLVY